MQREEIVKKAIEYGNKVGLVNMSRQSTCDYVGIADGSFSKFVGCSFSDFLNEIKPYVSNMNNDRLKPHKVNGDIRRDQIVEVALKVAETVGFSNMNNQDIADAAGISRTLVSRYFTKTQLVKSLMRKAIHTENLTVLAQGIVAKNRHALSASEELKERALKSLSE